MIRPCNKCKGKIDPQTGKRLYCTRCNSTGQMNRQTKAEKRQRKLAKIEA